MSRKDTLQPNLTRRVTEVIGSEKPIEIDCKKKDLDDDGGNDNSGRATIKRNFRIPPSFKKRGIKIGASCNRSRAAGHFNGPSRR